MEFTKSLHQLIWGVVKKLYLLLPALLAEPFDIAESLFGKDYNPPSLLGYTLLGLGLLIAITWTYHDLRKSKITVENERDDLKKQIQSGVRREHLVQFRSEYLGQLIGAIQELRSHLEKLVDKASKYSLEKYESEYLMDNENYQGIKQSYHDRVEAILVGLHVVHPVSNPYLRKLKQNEELQNKKEKLENLRAYISDTYLSNTLHEFLHFADVGDDLILSHKLRNNNKRMTSEEKLKNDKSIKEIQNHLRVFYIRVTKRIEELQVGDEAK